MKKILALVLAVMLVVSMTPAASALVLNPGTTTTVANRNSAGWRNTVHVGYVDTGLSIGVSSIFTPLNPSRSNVSGVGSEHSMNAIFGESSKGPSGAMGPYLHPGNTIRLFLGHQITAADVTAFPGEFTAADVGDWYMLTPADVSNLSLTHQITITSNNAAISSNSLSSTSGISCINVNMQNPFVNVNTLSFTASVYLLYGGARDTESRGNFSGTLNNYWQEVYENADWVYTYDMPVLDVLAYVRNIRIVADVDEQLTITSTVHQGRRYYARVRNYTIPSSIADANPQIYKAFNLDQVNINASVSTVRIGITGGYVYDGDLNYLGRTSENLPLVSTYYVADAMLPQTEVEPVGPSEATNPNSGGNGSVGNVNDNPGTGR